MGLYRYIRQLVQGYRLFLFWRLRAQSRTVRHITRSGNILPPSSRGVTIDTEEAPRGYISLDTRIPGNSTKTASSGWFASPCEPLWFLRYATSLVFPAFSLPTLRVSRRNEVIESGSLKSNLSWFEPTNPSLDITILHFHGGGFCTLSVDAYETSIRRLARRLGCRIVSVDYRRAPEHPYPQIIGEALFVYAHLTEKLGIPASKIYVMGDSAGGNISMSLCWKLPEESQPAGIVAISPVCDLTSEHIPLSAPWKDPILPLARYSTFSKLSGLQTSEEKRDNSILHANATDLAKLPPLLLFASEQELLFPEIDLLSKKIDSNKLTYITRKNLPHVWTVLGSYITEARADEVEIKKFIVAKQN